MDDELNYEDLVASCLPDPLTLRRNGGIAYER